MVVGLGLGRNGKATRELIKLHLANVVDGLCEDAEQFCEDLNDFLLENYLWMQDNIASYPEDRYWIQVNLTLNQVIGMIDGYDGKVGRRLSAKEIVAHPVYLLQLVGDMEDLATKFKKPETPRSLLAGTGHCSALIKLLPDLSDIYFSHVTWESYSTMLRAQKKYTFSTNDPGRSYSFSGYPGVITSNDDFVLTSARLAILETTIGNNNDRLLRYITPKTIMCWIRTQVAHRTSSTGLQWAKTFSKFNSGTYNNQWNILDYKLFKRGRFDQPSSGLLHVLEQIPNHTAHADLTHVLLRNTYWPSYNTPYFPKIFKWADNDKLVKKYGDWYTYDKTPRALIFRRDHNDVVDMESMIKLMRSNDYTKDPLAKCECDPPYSAENAISCRSDLNPANGTYPFASLGFRDHGSTDVKVTNSRMIGSLMFTAIAGPTHDPTPVFDWSNTALPDYIPHHGQPIRWEFEPVTHRWSNSLYETQTFSDAAQDFS
uniref:Phospholipase B-like n=1 Tax=Haemonchus contortus TaxID=6289 RepID=A0A7I5E8X6_HAECO